MNRRVWVMMVVSLGGAACLTGCGGPATATVSGVVTADGTPVEKGVIQFAALDGHGESASGTIENGKYEVTATPGKKRVSVSMPVPGPKHKESVSPTAGWVETTEEGIDERFNTKSELTFDVMAGGNTKDFEVHRKKRK